MTMLRALFLGSLLAGLALAACSAGGGGGAPAPAYPALGTNKPAASPTASGNPYSDSGY